jgi:hypothetical protein
MRGRVMIMGAEVKAESQRTGKEWRLVLSTVISMETECPCGGER